MDEQAASPESADHCETAKQDGPSLSRHIVTDPRMLKEIAVSFLRLGTTAFGGPAAHVAMMEEEFVRRRGWISHEEFLDMLGATNLIAGAFLDGVNVGALALMAAVTLQLGRVALVDVTTGMIATISTPLLIYARVNSAWLIFAAGLVGLATTRWFGG